MPLTWFLQYEPRDLTNALSVPDPSPDDWYQKIDDDDAKWEVTVFEPTEVPVSVTYSSSADKFTFSYTSVAGMHLPVSLTFNPDQVRPAAGATTYDGGMSRQLAGMLGMAAGSTVHFVSDSTSGYASSERATRWPRCRRFYSPVGREHVLDDAEFTYPCNAYRLAYSGSMSRPLLSILSDPVTYRGDAESLLNHADWFYGEGDVVCLNKIAGSNAVGMSVMNDPSVTTQDVGLQTYSDLRGRLSSSAPSNTDALFSLYRTAGSLGRRLGLDASHPAAASRIEMSRTFDMLPDQQYIVTLRGVPAQRLGATVLAYEEAGGTDRAAGQVDALSVVGTGQGWNQGMVPGNSMDLYEPVDLNGLHIRLLDQSGLQPFSTDGQDITYSFVFTTLVSTVNPAL